MRIYLLFLLLLCSLTSQAQYEQLANKTYGERVEGIYELFYHREFGDLDSIEKSARINKLEKIAQINNDDELMFRVRFMRLTVFKTNFDNNGDDLNALLKLLEIAKEKGFKGFSVEIHSRLADYYHNKKEYNKSIEHEISYYNLLKGLSLNDFPHKNHHIGYMANRYYGSGEYEGAKRYLLETKIPDDPQKTHIGDVNILNTLGLIYRKKAMYDSALYYFEKAISLIKKRKELFPNMRWYYIIRGNIGITYYLQGDYVPAISLLEKDVETSLEIKDYKNAINSIVKLADIYRLNGDYTKSWELTEKGRVIVFLVNKPYAYLASLYRLKGKLMLHTGNVALGYKYLDSSLNARDTLVKSEIVFSPSQTRTKLITEGYKHSLSKIEYEKKISIQERNSLIVGLVLLSFVGILFLTIQRTRNKQLSAEKKLADNKLENAQKRLFDFTKMIHEKNALLEVTTNEMDKLRIVQNKNSEEALTSELLQQLQKSTILTDDQWDEFKDLFEQVHVGFLHRVKEQLPKLTPAETRFIALTKLKFSNKEAANILGVSATTVRIYKYRLSKKLNLQEDDDLLEIIENI